MRRSIGRQLLVILFTVATLVVNALASTLPLNGQNTGEISDRFQVYFVPAGYVFSIWGLIYVALITFAVYQALPAQRDDRYLRDVDLPYMVSCLANMGWLFLWHYNLFVITVPVMLLLLLSLIAIYLRLGVGQRQVSRAQRWCLFAPFSLYLGWITVATIANVTSTLDYVQWSGWGITPELWTSIMLAAGVIIAALMAITRRDVIYLLVIVWAFAGIAVKHSATAVVAIPATVGAAMVAALAVYAWIARARRRGAVAGT